MRAPDVTVIDFETEAIGPRPLYPPRPVGVAIASPGEAPRYYAWGHPAANNCTEAQAKARLKEAWRSASKVPLLFQNGKFDLDVAETHLGLRMPPWHDLHDTLFLLFFTNPHARSLSLKPSAEAILGIKPVERDALRTWVLSNVPEAQRKPSQWGAYIAQAPGDVVGRYSARGDAVSTLRLFKHLWPQVQRRGMLEAYDRERKLLPILLQVEREGMRIDVPRLRRDLPVYAKAHERAAAWIRARLRAPTLNVDSPEELAQALLKAKVAKRRDFVLTPGGELSVAKESLDGAIKDSQLLQAIRYQTRLGTCLSMFMRRWLAIAEETGGTIHPTWHQVRQGYGDSGSMGARTGRLIASDPNPLNIAKSFEDRDDGYAHPRFLRVPLLPLVRVYVLPDRGCMFGHRDYNQQELRLLAHFEDGQLCRAYNENPKLDVHNFARDTIHQVTGLLIQARTKVKNLNFGDIYGLGIPGLVRKLKITVQEARTLKDAKRKAMPDVEKLKRTIKDLAEDGQPVVTIGGREYYPETPTIRDGRVRDFIYKLLNYLIQGSAADMDKQAVINYHEHPKRRGRFLVTVYDELNVSIRGRTQADARKELTVLGEAMQSFKLDVPLLTDAKVGRSWGELQKLRE